MPRNYTPEQKASKAAYDKIWHEKNPGKRQEMFQAWKAANPERRRLSQFKRDIKSKYGMTIEEYDLMVTKQNNLCAICNEPETMKKWGRLSIDHDHATGKVRGLLCNSCNAGIGYLKDSKQRLMAAIAYLESAQDSMIDCTLASLRVSSSSDLEPKRMMDPNQGDPTGMT